MWGGRDRWRAYKFVSDKYAAEFASCSSIQVGTFRAYRGLETGRGDPEEGRYGYQIDRFAPDMRQGLSEQDRTVFERIFGEAPKNAPGLVDFGMKNCRIRLTVPDKYVFCASTTPYAAALGGEGALFEITDFQAFIDLISSAAGGVLEPPARIGAVKYESRYVDPAQSEAAFNPFLKEPQFLAEQEIRAVWRPGNRLQPYIQVNAPLAAHFVRRLR